MIMTNYDMHDLEDARKNAELAVMVHNATLANLYRRDGSPLYADDVMHERATAARQVLTKELDEVAAQVDAMIADARAALAAGEGDVYTWLTTEELQRAALLMPFVNQDVGAMGDAGIRTLETRTRTGAAQLDRVRAWLYMREAERRELPTDGFTRAALPDSLTAALTLADEAERLQNALAATRPEWREQIMSDVVGQVNYSATGEQIAV